VTVKRVLAPGDERTYTVDLDQVAQGVAADFPITDGDVVHLPASLPRMIPYGAWELVRALVRVGGSITFF
jgi:hypothetical protein